LDSFIIQMGAEVLTSPETSPTRRNIPRIPEIHRRKWGGVSKRQICIPQNLNLKQKLLRNLTHISEASDLHCEEK
jgi:hypothetical protein